MKLQDLPKTAAETTVSLVRLPVDLVTKVREQFGGETKEAEEPPVKPARAKTTTKKPAARKKPAATKRNSDKPSGMTAELVKLACRASGVTPAQLNEHSKWKGAPWKWFFSNPKKTGVADRFGFKLKVERDGRAVTYFLTAK